MTAAPQERHEFGKWSDAELRQADQALADLRTYRGRIGVQLSQPTEFFEPSHKLDPDSRKEVLRKVKFYNQTSLTHALFLRHELSLKLLSVIDGYLVGIDQKNVLLVYLSARYTLELLATVNALSKDMNRAKDVDLRDWQGRGSRFLSALCRGRYASSDPKIAGLLKTGGVSGSALEPIKITTAIKELSKEEYFKTAVDDYDFLSNICHHNGSSHQLFHHSMRTTDRIRLPWGDWMVLKSPCPAITLEYPPATAFRAAIAQTARLVLSCVSWIDTILKQLPLAPFSDDDCSKLTSGKHTNALNYYPAVPPPSYRKKDTAFDARVGRNDPCPCGSGKKFKHCCLSRAD